VKYVDWNATKNEFLKAERGISFEEALDALFEGGLIDVVSHPGPAKYSHQRIMILNISEYVYLVPFVEDEEKVFLKTIIPSRKATKRYLIDLEKK
jgi:uncharacterized DUF497 family protein